MLSKISVKSLQTILQMIFVYSNSKFEVTCKNADCECRYIWAFTKVKPSKVSNITFTILLFYQKNVSNLMAILSTLESTSLDKPSDVLQNDSF